MWESSLCLIIMVAWAKQASVSKQELLDLGPDFDGTLYIDGDWVKIGWENKLETRLGKEITSKEWKKMR